ncbi:GAF and ANTAR domain-containing protein [Mycobacterium sp. AMU20-3851]|uniref:GAF and ANTAR domain-containing protein n=1 Tax=Mycobacterium sp. AMU20-3851 TaxID=3122055 RepID=UPI00375442EB
MQAINAGSVAMVAGARYAGITVIEADGTVAALGATHRFPAVLDSAQGETGEGPGLSAARQQRVTRVDDLQTDSRWPAFRQIALARTTVRSMLCVNLLGDDARMAALSLLAESPNAFTDESVEMATMLAAHTTMAWNLRRRQEQFSVALDSRDIIGQAKGMLMERYGIDADEAFALLKKMSQESNVKLSRIAENNVALTHPGAKRNQ